MSDNIQFKNKYKLNADHLGGDTGHGYEIPEDTHRMMQEKYRAWEIRRGFVNQSHFNSGNKLRGVALQAKNAYLNKLAAEAKKKVVKKKVVKKSTKKR
jgi:hypothetical protein